VDFTRVAEAADSASLEVLGFATQAAFLIGAGMETLLTTEMQLAADDIRRQAVWPARRAASCCLARWRSVQGHRTRPRLRRVACRLQYTSLPL
jgi:SAM-dependent MidA family methyltransferase